MYTQQDAKTEQAEDGAEMCMVSNLSKKPLGDMHQASAGRAAARPMKRSFFFGHAYHGNMTSSMAVLLDAPPVSHHACHGMPNTI